jgi:hypothetical protein
VHWGLRLAENSVDLRDFEMVVLWVLEKVSMKVVQMGQNLVDKKEYLTVVRLVYPMVPR